MAKSIKLKTVEDSSGKLTVFEKLLEGEIKRVFFIYDNNGNPRGGYRHLESTHALICQSRSCKVSVNNGKIKETFYLNKSFVNFGKRLISCYF